MVEDVRVPLAMAGDVLHGAREIAQFVFGDPKKQRKVYHLCSTGQLPFFYLGSVLCSRRSSLARAIQQKEQQPAA
ncbi:hypothetical protein SAMN05216360_1291 [Methylobacterium phyllostachyos]|uniref:Uncharacterized protein n=1 Tax=Methylobacterium phyllostachyos TaxID=582672 RepID=A0A1H0KSL8_9HYPH|nr:DNA-binding protein [Methylobacterium phyllostachyos]SDO58958.1 hypothetical protein SAMN05216360_1291 [Methylobacterium phyllostachyos]